MLIHSFSFKDAQLQQTGCLMTYQKYLSMNCAIFHHHYLKKIDFLVNHKSLYLQMIQLMTDDNLPEAQKNTHYVLDGGSLLHRIPWQKGENFSNIIQAYITYVHKHYPFATVVFDGYPVRPTVKDTAHIRRTHGINPLKVDFSEEMPCKMKKR